MSRLGFVLVLASTSAACTTGLSTRNTAVHDATVSARTKCDAQVLVDDRAVVDPVLVESVEPLYGHVHCGKGDLEARLIGAEIRLRSPDGLSPARVDRALECHAARRMLGLPVSPIANDPYGGTDSLVDIDVQSDHDVYVVRLTAGDFNSARQTLALANAYASEGRAAYASTNH
jgi:hypothetical protein